MTGVLASAALAFAASAALTSGFKRVAVRVNAVARPRKDRWNRQAIPLLGGAAIATTVLVIGPFVVTESPQVVAFFAGAAALFGLGLIDDFRNLRPQTKLAVEILVAASLAAIGLQLRLTSYPVLNVLITLFWAVGITNAFNLLDNMDGLAAGIAVIAAGFRLGFFLFDGNVEGAMLAAVFAGAVLGFLVHNFSPASIFMGDAGSLFIGFFVAGLSLIGGYPYSRGMASVLLFPVLILLVPIFDTTFVTISRTLARRRLSAGGRDHTSHRLVGLGLTERRAVVALYGVAALSGGVATITYLSRLSYAVVLIVFLGLAVTILGVYLSRLSVYPEPDGAVSQQNGLFSLVLRFTYRRQMATLVLDVGLMVLAYYTAYVLKFEDALPQHADRIVESMPVVIACQLFCFSLFRVHHGVWRYTDARDVLNIVGAAVTGTALTAVVLALAFGFDGYSAATFVIDAILLVACVAGSRLSMRLLAELLRPGGSAERRVVIYGAGDAGVLVCKELMNNRDLAREVVGFIDDDPRKQNRRIMGVPVLGGAERVGEILRGRDVDEVIVASSAIDPSSLAPVSDACEKYGASITRAAFRIE